MSTRFKNRSLRFSLNLLIFIGKLQGLIVFSYETVPVMSYNISPFLCAYSSVYTVLMVISLQALAIRILWGLTYYYVYTKTIMIIVYITEILITAYRVITVYIMQFYYRKNFRNILSEAVNLHQSIMQLMNGIPVFDQTFYRCYYSKVAGISFQLAIIAYMASLYRRIASTMFRSHIVTFTIIIYMHLTAITISGIFYAGMLFILMAYQNLNCKALQITNTFAEVQGTELSCNIKHRLYRRLGDEIDQIGYIYGRALAFFKKFSKLYSLQILFATLNTFFVVSIELFYVYDNVREINLNADLCQVLCGHIMKDFAFASCYAIELYHNVSISCKVAKQARITGSTFHALHHMNNPLKQNIELLSFQTLIVSPAVRPCGLFEINSTFLFAIAATIASYLVIFIQFDINDKSKNNTTLFIDFNY